MDILVVYVNLWYYLNGFRTVVLPMAQSAN
jgi:hypothetical protein